MRADPCLSHFNAKVVALFPLFLLLLCSCSRHFENVEECREFVKNSSGNADKFYVGAVACHWVTMASQDAEDKAKANTSQCILDKFASIKDDNSGTGVVTTCAESNDAALFGRALASKFSAQARLAKQMEEQHELQNALELERQQREMRERIRISDQQADQARMMMRLEEAEQARRREIRSLEIDGKTRSCSQSGDELICD